jgi:hypothetical protein
VGADEVIFHGSFVLGLDMSHNGILLVTDNMGRSSGEAFVHFANRDAAERALEKNKDTIGTRWGIVGRKPGWHLVSGRVGSSEWGTTRVAALLPFTTARPYIFR